MQHKDTVPEKAGWLRRSACRRHGAPAPGAPHLTARCPARCGRYREREFSVTKSAHSTHQAFTHGRLLGKRCPGSPVGMGKPLLPPGSGCSGCSGGDEMFGMLLQLSPNPTSISFHMEIHLTAPQRILCKWGKAQHEAEHPPKSPRTGHPIKLHSQAPRTELPPCHCCGIPSPGTQNWASWAVPWVTLQLQQVPHTSPTRIIGIYRVFHSEAPPSLPTCARNALPTML